MLHTLICDAMRYKDLLGTKSAVWSI